MARPVAGAWENARVTPRRIAYQGEPGANSHLVCKQHYPEMEALPCASFEDVFSAVETGEADLGLIPIDNSIAGRVSDIHHFLPRTTLHIIAEHFLRIQFALMALPGASVESIKTVHSHVHALGQCRKVIKELQLRPVIAGDTAGAAREVAEAGDLSQAAIAPPLAAETYGLEILREDVEDETHNTTRFVVLSRAMVQAPRGEEAVLVADLDLDLDQRRDWLELFPFLPTRRPDTHTGPTRPVATDQPYGAGHAATAVAK